MKVISTLSLSFPEFSLYDIKSSKEDVLKNAFFTAALYGDRTNKDNFMKSLDSLIKQNLIFMKIVVPVSMKADIEKEGLLQDNLLFEDSNSKEELFATTLNNAQTPYITFCDAEITYAVGSFRLAYRQLMKQQYDFISEGIYHKEYDKAIKKINKDKALEELSGDGTIFEKAYSKMYTENEIHKIQYFYFINLENLKLMKDLSYPLEAAEGIGMYMNNMLVSIIKS